MKAVHRTIGRLAREAGVGVETIRFYERRGLLKRPRAPSGGGYRHYEDEAVQLVRYIRIAQLNFTLKDVEGLLARVEGGQVGFCAAVRLTVEGKLADVGQEIAALEDVRRGLTSFLHDCRTRKQDRPCPILANLNARPGEQA